jgi:hypothetical protein
LLDARVARSSIVAFSDLLARELAFLAAPLLRLGLRISSLTLMGPPCRIVSQQREIIKRHRREEPCRFPLRSQSDLFKPALRACAGALRRRPSGILESHTPHQRAGCMRATGAWQAWCATHGLAAVDPTPETVAVYLRYRAGDPAERIKSATIQVVLAGNRVPFERSLRERVPGSYGALAVRVLEHGGNGSVCP